jgi:hypothetical protein
MDGRPWLSPGRPPWAPAPPVRWWHVLLVLADPARAARAWGEPVIEFRKDTDR